MSCDFLMYLMAMVAMLAGGLALLGLAADTAARMPRRRRRPAATMRTSTPGEKAAREVQ